MTLGFTLIELLVVISIISLLSSVVMVGVSSARQKAQITKAKSELGEFVKALEIYKTSYGIYPSPASCSLWCADDNVSESDFTSVILSELKNKNIYKGNLAKTLLGISNVTTYEINYYAHSGYNDWLASYFPTTCRDNNTATYKDFYFYVYAKDKNNTPTDLSSSYLSKEYNTNTGVATGNYCYAY